MVFRFKISALLFWVLFGKGSIAQNLEMPEEEESIFVALNNKKTYANARSYLLWGFVLGKKLNDRRLWQLGYYGFTGNLANSESNLRNQNFWFLGLTNYQNWRKFKNLHVFFPITLGLGSSNRLDDSRKKQKSLIFPLELGMEARTMFSPWLGGKIGLGIRLNLLNDFGTYSGPYYAFGLIVKPKELLLNFGFSRP